MNNKKEFIGNQVVTDIGYNDWGEPHFVNRYSGRIFLNTTGGST